MWAFLRLLQGETMIVFKCSENLRQLDSSNPAYPIVNELIERFITTYDTQENPYIPELYGYVILIEEADVTTVLDLPEVNCRLSEVRWEFTEEMGNFYYAAYLVNDELGLAFVIPKEAWLPQELKALFQSLL